jgi:UDP-N-acetylglucosamine 2-epimerase (non-hydrolysing)
MRFKGTNSRGQRRAGTKLEMRILHVVGARPNFMKVSPVHRALDNRAEQIIVHTGQHYDAMMSEIFFQQLGIPHPDANLEVGSHSHAEQTGQIMIRVEPVLLEHRPDLVLVYGDVNSTVAASLVCSKLGIKIGHVEAGLRSGDWSMPEEINRRVTDVLADLLFTPSLDANENLRVEGVPPSKVHFVGNVMIDTLVRLLPFSDSAAMRRRFSLNASFVLVTLHRPSNVDAPAALRNVLTALSEIAELAPIVFPIHPRTRARLVELEITTSPRLQLVEPLGYLEFLGLQREAAAVITDSGGVQEETTFLGVPCITVRSNTERPITVTCGTNVLVGTDMSRMKSEAILALNRPMRAPSVPALWDGHAGRRIADIVTSMPN